MERARRWLTSTWSGKRLTSLLLAVFGALLGLGFGFTSAVFTSATANAGNTFEAADDLVPPAVEAAAIQNDTGGAPGSTHQGGQYRVYANVTDDGNPSSGILDVTADLTAVSTGASEAVLAAGSWTVDGAEYNYRSDLLAVDAVVAEGVYLFSVTATDGAANTHTETGFSLVIDNTPPTVPAAVVESVDGAVGYVSAGGGYRVYAHAVDGGSPASGVRFVRADLSALTPGQSSYQLTPGTWEVDGVTYTYASPVLLADGDLEEGPLDFGVHALDEAGNTGAEATFGVDVDNTPPTVVAAVIQKATGGLGGYLAEGATYHLYAQITDGASGTGTVVADASGISTGQDAVSLTAGTWTVDGVGYSHRSGAIVADSPLDGGPAPYSVTASDLVGNTATPAPFAVTIDNTPPVVTASVVQLENGGHTGYVGQGMTYRVYASATDNEVVQDVSADVETLSAGQSTVALEPAGGPWTVDGTSYTHRSAVLTADDPLADGPAPYSVTARDAADNTATAGFSVTVDNNATIQPASDFTVTGSCVAETITFVGAASSWSSGGITLSIPKPSGLVEGDVLVGAAYGRNAPVSSPSGWTLLLTQGNLRVWYRVAGDSEPASYAFGSNERSAGGITAYRGVSMTSPVHVFGSQSGSGSSITAPGVTTTVPDTVLVAVWGNNHDGSHTIAPGMAGRFSQPSNDNGASAHQVRVTAADEAFAAPGGTGDRVATATAATNAGALLALRPRSLPRVTATWTATPSSFAEGYRLQRWLGAAQETNWTLTPRTTTSYVDDEVTGTTAYTYRLRAFADIWDSTEVSDPVTTPACSP